jgi:hypothetical protein
MLDPTMDPMVDPTAFGYGDLNFSWGDHICAIYDDPGQQMDVAIPFMRQGIRAGQRCVWISAPSAARRFRDTMTRAGCDLPTLEASGQLVVISDVEFYLKDGLFQPDSCIALARTLLEDGQQHGYSAMRLTGDPSWLQEGALDFGLWEDYEHQVTREIADSPVVILCQYDRRRFPGSQIVTALLTHPIVILGDNVARNPYFVPPPTDAIGPRDIV